MAKMGDWRDNKDEEIELDGIGGVSILVKADVHRSGWSKLVAKGFIIKLTLCVHRHQLPLLRV